MYLPPPPAKLYGDKGAAPLYTQVLPFAGTPGTWPVPKITEMTDSAGMRYLSGDWRLWLNVPNASNVTDGTEWLKLLDCNVFGDLERGGSCAVSTPRPPRAVGPVMPMPVK